MKQLAIQVQLLTWGWAGGKEFTPVEILKREAYYYVCTDVCKETLTEKMLFHCVSLPLKAIDTEIKQSPGRRLEIVLVLKAECMQNLRLHIALMS